MHQITYISTVAKGTTEDDLRAILASSRRNNARVGITGLLLHDGKRFLQVLEGESAPLREALVRIKADRRHLGVVILSERDVAAREFGPWAMGEQRVSPAAPGKTMGETVDALVAGVPDPNVRAMFSSFARRTTMAA